MNVCILWQNIWGIYKTVALLYGNEIVRWQVKIEKQKRNLALKWATLPDEGATQLEDAQQTLKLTQVVECANEVVLYNKFVSDANQIMGVEVEIFDTFSTLLCIGHAFAVAFYNSENSISTEKAIDWALRAFTFVHMLDVAFRLAGMWCQKQLTTRRKQVSVYL